MPESNKGEVISEHAPLSSDAESTTKHVETDSEEQKGRKGGSKRTKEEPETDVESIVAVDVYIKVQQPADVIRTAQRKKRVVARKPVCFGPVPCITDNTWDEFLVQICGPEGLGVTKQQLVLASMTWRFNSPSNSPSLPIRNENGYKAMIRQVLVKPAHPTTLTMKPPKSVEMPAVVSVNLQKTSLVCRLSSPQFHD